MLWLKICRSSLPHYELRCLSLILMQTAFCLGLAATIWTKPTNAIALNLILHSLWCNSCSKIISRFGWLSCFLRGFVDGLEFKWNDWKQEWKTLPKAQRTRGLSSYHSFWHKFWSNFNFRNLNRLKLKIFTKPSFQILDKIQLRILAKPCAQSRNKS